MGASCREKVRRAGRQARSANPRPPGAGSRAGGFKWFRVWHRAADFRSPLVLAQTLVDDLAQGNEVTSNKPTEYCNDCRDGCCYHGGHSDDPALKYYAATGSISVASLFLTFPTRALTGQQVISSDGNGASSALREGISADSSPSQMGQVSGFRTTGMRL